MQYQVLVSCLVFIVLAFAGCGREPADHSAKPVDPADVSFEQIERPPPRELEERDFEVIRFALRQPIDHPQEPLCFLTVTPREFWGTEGDWESLSPEFHRSLNSLDVAYHSADQAKLKSGYVRDIETDAPGTMVWVTVKKWISATEVEVESGSWGGPLDAFGSTAIYEKLDGHWKLKTTIHTWLS